MFDLVNEWLAYAPATGVVTWRKQPHGGATAVGRPAGSMRCDGYIVVVVKFRAIPAHRAGWMLFHDAAIPPGKQIDHINGDRADNRIANLRLCDRTGNRRNSVGSREGYKGVRFRAVTGKWEAAIHPSGRNIHLGTFDTAEAAARAYDAAARQHYGEFARPNFSE